MSENNTKLANGLNNQTDPLDEAIVTFINEILDYDHRMIKAGAPNIRFTHEYSKKLKAAINAEIAKAFRAGQVDCQSAGDPTNHRYFQEACAKAVEAAKNRQWAKIQEWFAEDGDFDYVKFMMDRLQELQQSNQDNAAKKQPDTDTNVGIKSNQDVTVYRNTPKPIHHSAGVHKTYTEEAIR